MLQRKSAMIILNSIIILDDFFGDFANMFDGPLPGFGHHPPGFGGHPPGFGGHPPGFSGHPTGFGSRHPPKFGGSFHDSPINQNGIIIIISPNAIVILATFCKATTVIVIIIVVIIRWIMQDCNKESR